MKIFAINLKREPHKRTHILNECEKYNLEVEIIDAVDGKTLSEEYLKDKIYNYPDCKLTKGEIGCALSHLKIYEKMVSESIPFALILEDDAVFKQDPNPLLAIMNQHISSQSPYVYLLSGCLGTFFSNETMKIQSFTFYKAYDSYLAHGYLITLKSAKNLLKLQEKVKFESDRWYFFELFDCVKTYCLLPLLIKTNDSRKVNSSLEQDRSNNVRRDERHNQIRKIYNSNLNAFFKRKLLKLKLMVTSSERRRDGLDI